MHCLQYKKRKFLKDVCTCDEGVRKVRDEINEREARFLELAEKSSNCLMAADDLEEEIKGLQAGKERRGSCEMLLRLGHGAAFHFGSGACETADPSPARRIQPKVRGSSHSHAHDRKRRERRRVRSKRKERSVAKWVHKRQVGAMKAFRLVLLLILLGTRMQTVRAVEEEISIRQEMDHKIEKVLVPHADSSNICERMKCCEREKKKKQSGEGPSTFEDRDRESQEAG